MITPENHVIEGMLTGGNVADIPVADALTADIVGCHVIEDRGCDSDDHRRELKTNNIEIVYDKVLYTLRCGIERYFGKLKENRRLAVRYEKLDATFLGFIAIASIKAFNLC